MAGKAARTLAVSPRIELFFALAAALAGLEAGAVTGDAGRWLDQARRKLDQGFRRRLGDQGQTPGFWRRLATLPLSRDATASADAEGVIAALAALPPECFQPADDPEALQRLVVDTLRRFDRLAFAGYWRRWREELRADAARIEARLRDFPVDVKTNAAVFLPSRFASPDFVAPVAEGDAVLLAFDPDRLPPPAESTVAMPRATASMPGDPALIFRALGDATRYTIAGLIAREPMTSAELARRLDVSKPTMAHHLRALRAAGLVGEETRGTAIVLTLDRSALEDLSDATVAQFYGSITAAPIRRSRRR